MTFQEQVESFLNLSERLQEQLYENNRLRAQYLDVIINILREARNSYSHTRINKIDEALDMLREWKSSLIEETT